MGSLTLRWSDDRPEGLYVCCIVLSFSLWGPDVGVLPLPHLAYSVSSQSGFSDHFNMHVCPCVPSPLGYVDQWYSLACCGNTLLLSLCLTAVLAAGRGVALPLHLRSEAILLSEQILALKSGVIQGRTQPGAAFPHSVG